MTVGVLVQLAGAGDYLVSTESTRAEFFENLVPLDAALSVFYGRKPPRGGLEQEVVFLRNLCKDRFADRQTCRLWRGAADALRVAVFADAAKLCPDVVADVRSGVETPPHLCANLSRLAKIARHQVSVLQQRWPPESLVQVERCKAASVQAVVVEISKKRIWVNGLDVVPLNQGRLPKDPDLAPALQSMLAAGAAVVQAKGLLQDSGPTDSSKVPRDTRAGKGGTGHDRRETEQKTSTGSPPPGAVGSVIIRARKGVSWSVVAWMLRLAASVNLSRAWLRVARGDGLPCLVPVRVWNLPLAPNGKHVDVGPGAVLSLCHSGDCSRLDPRRLARMLGCKHGRCGAWYLTVHTASVADVVTALSALSEMDGTGPLLWVPKRLTPRREGAVRVGPSDQRPSGGRLRHRPGRPGAKRGLVPRL